MLRDLASTHGLTVLGLQPLNQFDGWAEGHPRKEWSRRKAERWLPLLSKLGCEFLQVRGHFEPSPSSSQVGSNNMPDASNDLDIYAADLRWLGQLGAVQDPPVKIAYELWCFSVHINTWEQCWEVVKRTVSPQNSQGGWKYSMTDLTGP